MTNVIHERFLKSCIHYNRMTLNQGFTLWPKQTPKLNNECFHFMIRDLFSAAAKKFVETSCCILG